MRRADRLFELILLLDRGRVVTARALAEALQVSERTVYRDVADLGKAGVPISGEAGVGYQLRPGYRLSPLMFDAEELAALALGARMVQGWSDAALGAAAGRALRRIEAVLPKDLRTPSTQAMQDALLVPDFHIAPELVAPMALLRTGINQQRKISLRYVRADGTPSERVLWPLGLVFWGALWTLGAWCELRQGFRTFRLDRMGELHLLNETFPGDGLLAEYLHLARQDSADER